MPPDCPRCRHYLLTYQAHQPHGCRFFGIRTAALPAIEVLRSSGKACQAFEKRPGTDRPESPSRS